jgi:LysR family transcriptional regulator, nod-box dependent transcriptional activator
MRFKGLDLNLLVALDALLMHQNVTRAAEQLSISQSAMSGALARLREHFQDELLVQVQRRMVLTSLAQSLQQPLRTILANTSKLLNARSGFDPATSERRFTISCSDYVWAVLITEVLSNASAQAPGVEIYYAGTSSRFERSDADLLIAPEGYITKGHPCEELFREKYVCIVWAGNQLVEASLSEQQYSALGHVVAFSDRPTFVQEWLYQRYGEVPRIGTIAPSFTLIPHSVVRTKHVATVPLRLAETCAAHLPLRILPPPIHIPMMVDFMQWRVYQSNDSGLLWLRTLIKKTAKHVSHSE